MIFYGLIVIMVVWIAWWNCNGGNPIAYGDFNRPARFLIPFIACVLAFGVFTFIYSIELVGEMEGATRFSTEIYSLRTIESIESRFVLGSGYINGVERYVFMQKRGEGYLRGYARCDQTIIIESETVVPQKIWREGRIYTKWWYAPFRLSKHTESWDTLYVPKGTIIKEFKIR